MLNIRTNSWVLPGQQATTFLYLCEGRVVRSPDDCFRPKCHLKSRVFLHDQHELPPYVRAGIVQCLWATGLRIFFFIFCHNSSLNKVIEAMVLLNLYENRTVTACLRTVSGIRAGSVGWLVGCFGLNGSLRQYFSLYRAVSQREGERGERICESKNVQTIPTRTYCKRNRPLPYCNQNCRTPGTGSLPRTIAPPDHPPEIGVKAFYPNLNRLTMLWTKVAFSPVSD